MTQQQLFTRSKTHDAFVEIIQMTSEECANKGEKLSINYSFANSMFGEIILASTEKGICYLAFLDDKETAFSALKKRFQKASFSQQGDDYQRNAVLFFTNDWSMMKKVKLHITGTDFQLNVWRALLKIPMGNLTTYGNMATTIQQPKAARAVGTAIGSNPIAFIIPCHRVIQSSGGIGGYMWGTARKIALIEWETNQIKSSEE